MHKALNLQTGGMVAIKKVALRGESKDQLQLLQREIDLLKLLKNPYIVEYRESFNTKDTLYIVMEFVENGSLSTMLKKYGRLPEALVGVYTVQVLGGLHYLHEQGVIHRDIKGANILISTEGRVKLADFRRRDEDGRGGVRHAGEHGDGDAVLDEPRDHPDVGPPPPPNLVRRLHGHRARLGLAALLLAAADVGALPHRARPAPAAARRHLARAHRLPDGVLHPRRAPAPVGAPPPRAPLARARWRGEAHSAGVGARERLDAARLGARVGRRVGGGLGDGVGARRHPRVRRAEGGDDPRDRDAAVPPWPERTPTDPSKEGTLNWQESRSPTAAAPARRAAAARRRRRRRRSRLVPERAASVAGIKPPTPAADDEAAERRRPRARRLLRRRLARDAGGRRAAAPPSPARRWSRRAATPARLLSFDGRESDGLLTGTSLPSIGSAADLDLMVDGRPPRLAGAPSRRFALAGARRLAAGGAVAAADARHAAGRRRLGGATAARVVVGGVARWTWEWAARRRRRVRPSGNGRGWHRDGPAAAERRGARLRALLAPARRRRRPAGLARTAPSPSGGGGDYGLSGEGALAVGDSDDYIDPFSHIERANVVREGDEEHKKQRAHLRSLIHELQQAAETKNEQRTLQVSEQLTSYFEGIEKKAAEAAAAAAADADWEGGGGGGNGGRRNGQRLHGEITAFVSEHGMLPLVTSLRTMTGTKVTLQLLRLLNALLDGGGPSVCETACLLGVIPPALRFVENQYPPRTRLQAARFTHLMCTRAGAFTLQMFVACQGLPAVVILLADAANGRELVLLAVDAIKAVLDMRGRSPRNDLCRTLVDLDILQLLVDAMHEIAPHHKGHADKCAEIFLLFSCADPVVKARMATGRAGGRVLHGLMRVLSSPENFESALTLKVLRCIKHLCMGEAAHMDELQKARAVPHLVALLRVKQGGGRLEAEMRNQCVNALYLLCQISRSRQEEAALHGVLPLLQEIIRQRSPLKEFALPIVCDIAKASKVARVQLKKQAAVEFYLDLSRRRTGRRRRSTRCSFGCRTRRRTSTASWSPPTASPSSRPSSTRPPPRRSPTCSSRSARSSARRRPSTRRWGRSSRGRAARRSCARLWAASSTARPSCGGCCWRSSPRSTRSTRARSSSSRSTG